jgi:hypothetical protein
MMRDTDGTSLQSLPTQQPAHDAFDGEPSAADGGRIDSRFVEPKTTRLFVLVGSGIAQLPIWGDVKLLPALKCY